MSEIEVIRKIAREILRASAPAQMNDKWLWNRNQRVLQNVELICKLPEVVDANLAIDLFCLTGATFFSDTGYFHYTENQKTSSKLVLADVMPNDLQTFSTQIVSEKLAGVISAKKIEKINKIIIESSSRFTKMTEAMILSDARNLDDMGAVGIFGDFRRYVIGNKGIADALKSWKRKIDYRYWEARLKDSFQFQSVRNVAARRFRIVEQFINALDAENSARDLQELIIESIDKIGVDLP